MRIKGDFMASGKQHMKLASIKCFAFVFSILSKPKKHFPQKARFRFVLAHNLYVNFWFCVEAKNAVSPIKSMLSNAFYFNFKILVLAGELFQQNSSFPTAPELALELSAFINNDERQNIFCEALRFIFRFIEIIGFGFMVDW